MKKNILSLVIILFGALHYSFAQQITFQKTFGGTGDDDGVSVRQTTDGGYIITGQTNCFVDTIEDVYLIKTDSMGDSLWVKTYGETWVNYGASVQQTVDGGFIIAGTKGYYFTGGYDGYLVKTNSNGDTLWTKTTSTGHISVSSVCQTSEGGYIMTGSFNSNLGAGDDVYLIETDSIGNFLWAKTFGGPNYEQGSSVQQTTDGGFIIVGQTQSFGSGDIDVYLLKTDSIGNLIWSKTFGGSGGDAGRFVQQTADGGYIITGITSSFSTANNDIYLIKTDSIGNLIWSKTFGGINNDWGLSVKQTTDSGYIIVGQTNSFGAGDYDVYLIKTNVNGNTLWTRTFGGTSYDVGRSVQQTMDGGYITVGCTNSFGAGGLDVYLVKTDSLGNNGCNQSSPATIVTTPATIVTTPATIVTSPTTVVTTPATIVGSGGVVTTLCTSVGITPVSNSQFQISISPNPAEDEVTVSSQEFGIRSIEIENIVGEHIFNLRTLNSKLPTKIDVSLFSSGVYFIRVTTVKGSFVRKFVKE
jgi:hypothetical protein